MKSPLTQLQSFAHLALAVITVGWSAGAVLGQDETQLDTQPVDNGTEQTGAAVDQATGELLDAIERSSDWLVRLSAQVQYDKEFALAGDLQRRQGELFFERDGDERSFAIRFTKLILDDVSRDEVQEFVFDGEWLVERQPGKKLFTKRQVVPPGGSFDPLKIGEGPLPIPIGQKRVDIERSFDASVRELTESIDEGTVAWRIASSGNPPLKQLLLTPKPGTREAEDFDEIRVWYRQRDGGVVPAMARTVNGQGDIALVILILHEVNDDAQIPEDVFSTEAPRDGWDVQILPYREGADASPTFETETALTQTAFAFDPPKPGDRRLGKKKLSPKHDPSLMIRREVTLPAVVMEPPTMAATVGRLLEAPYLSDEERSALRVKHGFWTDEDVASVDALATAALVRHAWSHPVFDDEDTRADLRAEALLKRGEPERAIDLLAGDSSVRGVRLRAEALAMLGRFEEADAALEPLVDRLQRVRVTDADEMCDAVLAMMLRAKLRGQERSDGTDFDTLMALLKHARENLDPMSWRVRLVEAKLLFDKHNRSEARDAAMEALSLNPASAGAMVVMGDIWTGSFSFDETVRLAFMIDSLGAGDSPWWTGEGEADVSTLSASGALVRARARLRQDDPDGALSLLEEALVATPEHRSLLAMRAGAIAQGYDEDETTTALSEFDALSPGAPEAAFMAGWALAERRQYELAAVHFEEAMRRLPTWPEPAIELGLLEIQSGRDDRARAALEAAAELDPFNTRAANSLTLLNKLASHETIESEHFVVRYRPGIDELLAREMLPRLEAMHETVTAQDGRGLGFEPSRKTLIELMPDHAMFAVRITGMPALYTVAACTGPVIAMERPMLSPEHTIGPYDWERVLRHEYTHTVSLALTKNRIPHWFTEAVAQHLEDAPKSERTCRLLAGSLRSGSLFAFDEINERFVRPRPNSSDRELAYAQGLWMYEFMVERFGAQAPLELMAAYAMGTRQSEAMQSVLGIDQDEFRSQFEVWAFDMARGWGALPEEGTPSIIELAQDEGVSLPPGEEDIEAWLAVYPTHPGLLRQWFELTRADETFGEGELSKRAVAAAREYAEASPIAEAPHRALVRHFLAGPEDQRDEALEHLRFLAAREQYNPGFAAQLSLMLADRGELDEAWAWAERASIIAPFEASPRENGARIALARRDLVGAERHLTMLAAVEPERELHQRRLTRVRELIEAGG